MKFRRFIRGILSRRSPAFTLVEISVTTAISSLLFVAVGGIAIYSGRSLTAISNYADLERQSRYALDLMTMELRQALSLTTIATNSITFMGSDTQSVTYIYNTNGTFSRQSGTFSTVLLTNCDSLKFTFYGQTISTNDFSLTSTTDLTSCYLISVNWTCSKSMIGVKMNTESVKSASILLRNK